MGRLEQSLCTDYSPIQTLSIQLLILELVEPVYGLHDIAWESLAPGFIW